MKLEDIELNRSIVRIVKLFQLFILSMITEQVFFALNKKKKTICQTICCRSCRATETCRVCGYML